MVLAVLVLAGAAGVALYWWHLNRLEHSQDGPIRAAAARYQVPPALVKAVVWRESRFDPRARGAARELGLMQPQEEAAREWAAAEHLDAFEHEWCLDPVTNTLAGTFYLRKLLNRYRDADHPVPFALADYNAGRGNVLKWARGSAATNSEAFLEAIRFPGTRAYIAAVLERCERYRPEFEKPQRAQNPDRAR